MKKLIIFFAVLILFCFFPFTATADTNEYYSEQYELINGDEILSGLDRNSRNYLKEKGLTPKSSDWVNSLNFKSVFSYITDFIIKGGFKKSAKLGGALISVILITAAVSSFKNDDSRFAPALYAGVITICALISGGIFESVKASVNAIKGISTFMASFIPTFTAVSVLSGSAVSSAVSGASLLAAAQGLSSVCSFVIAPLMGAYLGLSVASSVSPLLSSSGLEDALKKIVLWTLSLISTVFTGILGIQSAVNSAADTLSLKITKFILGTTVPVAGAALSESVNTVTASVGLLRSSIGIYGVFALAFTVLPIIIQLLLWRLCLMVCVAVSRTLSLPKISGLLKAVDSMFSLLIGLTLLCSGTFIIGLTVVVTAGGAK